MFTLDNMNLSEEGCLGSSTLYRIVLKNKTDRISAADIHEVGCLEVMR